MIEVLGKIEGNPDKDESRLLPNVFIVNLNIYYST